MKTKTSITLSEQLLVAVDEYAQDYRSRSAFIEAAVLFFVADLERREAELRDLEIINRQADSLNDEAADVLGYQAPL